MPDESEVKTEQLKIGGAPIGALVKLFERVGLAPVLLVVLAVCTFTYIKFQEGVNLQRQVTMIKKLNRIEMVTRASKGCVLNMNEQEREDRIFEEEKKDK